LASGIALEEADESAFWLEILAEGEFATNKRVSAICNFTMQS
jgi:hypothetical protein